jgi:ornithine cyclodeaminase
MAAMEQAAEFVRAREQGLVDESWISGEIGAVLDGTMTGRRNPDEITVYKSLGTIAQDLCSGLYAYQEAIARGIGIHAEL